MKIVMRALIAVVGLFNLALGLIFLLAPARIGAKFFVAAIGVQGLATMRADFTAFFVTASLCALYGAWKARPAPLTVPMMLLAIALSGRGVSIALDGVVSTTATPMIAEAAMLVVLWLGYRSFSAKN